MVFGGNLLMTSLLRCKFPTLSGSLGLNECSCLSHHRVSWVERNLRHHPIPTPFHGLTRSGHPEPCPAWFSVIGHPQLPWAQLLSHSVMTFMGIWTRWPPEVPSNSDNVYDFVTDWCKTNSMYLDLYLSEIEWWGNVRSKPSAWLIKMSPSYLSHLHTSQWEGMGRTS